MRQRHRAPCAVGDAPHSTAGHACDAVRCGAARSNKRRAGDAWVVRAHQVWRAGALPVHTFEGRSFRAARLPACLAHQVQIFEDPVYGTPVFKTLSGTSKCPWEVGTLAREAFSVVLTQSSFPALPVGEEQPMRVTLINLSETQEPTLVQIAVGSNAAGFTVRYNGQALPSAPTEGYFLLGLTPTFNPTINIPGSTLNSSGSIDFYLTVSCGANATATSTLKLLFSSTCDPTVNAVQEISVTCMQPCPVLQWAMPTTADQPMLINNQYLATQGATVRTVGVTMVEFRVGGMQGCI